MDYSEMLFDIEANEPVFWLTKALELLYASKLLENNFPRIRKKRYLPDLVYSAIRNKRYPIPVSFHTQDVNFMIKGMSFECLFKTIVLINGDTLYEKREIKNKYKKHDLNKLAEMVGFIALPEERKLLQSLTLSLIAFGRYPTNTKYKKDDYDRSGFNHSVYINLLKRMSDKFFTMISKVDQNTKKMISDLNKFVEFYYDWYLKVFVKA